MNEATESGYRLFTQYLAEKFGATGAMASLFPTLLQGALPAWQKLAPAEKQVWIAKATEVEAAAPRRQIPMPTPRYTHRTTPGNYYTGNRKNRRVQQRKEDFRPIAKDDEEDEDEIGVPVANVEEAAQERELQEKYTTDKQLVMDQIMEQTDGCLDKIKDLRFLLASVQTFGNVDNECMMAEYAVNEFNLKDGVIDRFSSVIGPWKVDNEIQRSRATFHSNETHRIPLQVNNTMFDKRTVVMEILGRSEPAIASKQGLRVGLYTDETEDMDERLNRLYMGDKFTNHIVDRNNRRWIICLRQEYHYMVAASQHLKDTVGLDYSGFPCTGDRFILADAFVDAIAECLDGKPMEQCGGWLGSLGNHLPEEFSTPWERSGELFCGRHRHDRNSCCATVTASRSTFIILYCLEDILQN